MNNKNDIINKVIKRQATRIETTKSSHLWFFHTYLHDYVQYEIAPYQKEMFRITEDDNVKLAVICSFRGSGKSTLMTLSLPIWSMLGRMQKKFVMIISQTQDQAKLHFKNLKNELETNELLKRDLGPFQEQNEWNACSLIIPRYNAKIVAVSREQAIRGARHGRYRPDLIIADDIEDVASVKTAESRKNTREWFTSEVLPIGDKNTKVVVVGNLLHQDSLLMTLQKDIFEGRRSGEFHMFPLLNEKNEIAWLGKYPDMKAIQEEEQKIGDKFAWYREYLLRIIDDSEPVVPKSWIKYYDQLPKALRDEHTGYAMGIDLAISEKETADYTSIVSAKIYGYGKKRRIYILPHPVNKRMSIKMTQETIEHLVESYGGRFETSIYVEDVMLQSMLTQLLVDDDFMAEGMKVGRLDKRSRLHFCSSLIQSGEIMFPREGCKELLDQITEFGTTAHDDCVDAFTVLIMKLIEEKGKGDNCEMALIKGSGMWGRDSVIDDVSKIRSRRDWSRFLDEEDRMEYSRR